MVSAVVEKRGGREEARDRGGGVHAQGEQDFGGSLMDKVWREGVWWWQPVEQEVPGNGTRSEVVKILG